MVSNYKANPALGTTQLVILTHDLSIFPTISFINHSCSSNCKVIESQGNLVLETRQPIEEGVELTINYGFELEKHSNPVTRRLGCKEEMHKSFLFTCDCSLE